VSTWTVRSFVIRAPFAAMAVSLKIVVPEIVKP
jgi:hypothetical protein